ncbi:MAG: TldD/PmbA family protein [Chloroflexi bacterium]|nr:MAG: TldD/PmbA family protein [Chloroflexota bacterium]
MATEAAIGADLVEAALEHARRLGADQAEAFYTESTSDSVDYENNRLAGIDSSSSRGIGIRVLAGGRVGFSSTSILDRVEDAVEAALQTARLTEVEMRPFSLPAGGSIDADISDREVEAISVGELVEMGRQAIDRLQPLADGLLAGAGAGRAVATVRIGNSAGLRSSCRRSSWSFFALAQRVQGTSVLWCYDGGASMHRDLDVDGAIEGASEKVRLSLKEGRLETGRRPVVFTPAALAALLASLYGAVSAPAIYRKTSPLTGRLGEQVLSPMLSIEDDNRPEAGRAGAPFDEEGVAAFAFPIVEHGVFRNVVADLRFAARLDVAPGRGRRSGYASAPFPGAGNWAMAPGTTPLEELMSEAEGGLLVDSLLGMHGSNLANGDFSANIGLGFAIGAGGEIQFRVKDAAIAGNFYELLGDRLLGLSAERRWGYSGTELLPSALCADVAIT